MIRCDACGTETYAALFACDVHVFEHVFEVLSRFFLTEAKSCYDFPFFFFWFCLLFTSLVSLLLLAR